MSEDNQHPPMVIAHRGGENLNKTIKYFFLENSWKTFPDKIKWKTQSPRERERETTQKKGGKLI